MDKVILFFLFIVFSIMTIACSFGVMIYGWGLTPKSWTNIVVYTILGIIFQITANIFVKMVERD